MMNERRTHEIYRCINFSSRLKRRGNCVWGAKMSSVSGKGDVVDFSAEPSE
jgi:hypothetical protein